MSASPRFAPAIWGSTYIVTTQLLPPGMPLTVAALRALPAGLLLLVIVRRLPQGEWWWKSLLLGALNFTCSGPACLCPPIACRAAWLDRR